MADLMIHLVEANVLLLFLLAIYFVVRQQLAIRTRRLLLLVVPVLSALIFALRLVPQTATMAVYRLPVYEIGSSATKVPGDSIFANYPVGPEDVYWCGVIIAFLWTGYRTFRLLQKIYAVQGQWTSGVFLVRMKNESCFSFFNVIQINPELDADEQQVIFEHELIHVRKRHSYDLLFLQLIRIFNWFNPALTLLQREMQQVHEYDVDQEMYSRHQAGYMEFLLAYSLGSKTRRVVMTNSFYSSQSLIKRIQVMKTKTKNRWAAALALPLFAGAFMLVSWTYGNASGYRPELHLPEHDQVVQDGQTLPEFPGGNEAMADYLTEHLMYPEPAKKNHVEGTVYVGFVITKTGSITNCKIRKGVSEELDAEALRVVCEMPDWIPATQGNEPVNAEMTIPINFKL